MRYFVQTSRTIVAFVIGIVLATSFTSLPAFALTGGPVHQNTHTPTVSCLQPPQNVDLMTLSDSALQSYGLPTHAEINQNLTFWKQALAHAKHRTCGMGPSDPKTKHNIHRNESAQAGAATSQDWSGYEATGSRGTYRAATMEFNVPQISLSDSNATVVIWAGVGGDDQYAGAGAVLPQVGVLSEPSGSSQYNESWWEDAGSSSDNGLVNLPLNRLWAGDRVFTYVSSNLQNDGYNYYEIENVSTDNYNSHQDQGAASDSATGECILERLVRSGSPTDLAEFNPPAKTEEIDSCEILDRNATENSIGNWPHTSISMVNGTTPLDSTGGLGNAGQNFVVTWIRSS